MTVVEIMPTYMCFGEILLTKKIINKKIHLHFRLASRQFFGFFLKPRHQYSPSFIPIKSVVIPGFDEHPTSTK